MLAQEGRKDVACFNLLIRQALKKTGSYYYLLPTYRQARLVLFEGMTMTGQRFLDYIPEELIVAINKQEMKIELVNGSRIYFLGSDNFDSLRGSNPSGIVFSEYAFQHPETYPTLRPILVANDGWCVFISTPFGQNHFYTLYEIAKNSPDWFCDIQTVEDTGVVSQETIEKEREEGLMSQDMIEQEYYCFPGDQSVVTYDGIRSIDDIKKNDLVFTHTGRIRKVMDTISRDYSGDICEIKSYGSGEIIKCTPDHPLRTYDRTHQTYIWKKAKDVSQDDWLVFPKMALGKYPIIPFELCMLLSWYICDGSAFKNGIQFTVGYKESVERITSYLDALNIAFSVYKNRTAFNIVCNSVQLVDFFKANCGTQANNKKIPFSLICGFEKEFFYELMKGDGCYNEYEGTKKYMYSTVSKALAYQVQLLAHSINDGFSAGISKRDAHTGIIEDRIVNCQESYQVSIWFGRLGSKQPYLIRAKNCIAARVKNTTKSHFSGKVYNLSVQYDESYLITGRAVHNCSFSTGALGSYYGKYLNNMELNDQITSVPWEPSFQVNTAWDLGVRDSTVIIFFQLIGKSVHIIDSYSNDSKGLEHYVGVVKEKPYNYNKHFAPHDIMVREFGSGMSRWDKAKELGVKFEVKTDRNLRQSAVPNVSIMDGIEAVRSTLPRIWIDRDKCRDLIKSIRDYRKEYDDRNKVYKAHPLHDSNSHWCDALRYLCLSLKRCQKGTTAEDLDRNYREAMMGPNAHMPEFFR